MAADITPPRKEGDTRWAQEYLLDPLNAVEAYQTAQTGGQYNNSVPTQHKTVSIDQFQNSSTSTGLSRSRSILSRSGSKKKKNENDGSQDVGTGAGAQVRRTSSIRDKLMRRFTDDGRDPDRRQRPLRALNEVSDKEISRMGNTAPVRGTRQLTPAPAPEEAPDIQIHQDKNDLQNQENRPVSKKTEDRWSNNPYREALRDAENRENRTPPESPTSSQGSPTNPFRRGGERSPPPQHFHAPRSQSRALQPSRSMQRGDGPRPAPKSRSRHDAKPRPLAQRALAADTIDSLDTSFGLFTFHHEGPYDATLSHRNRNPLKSPVQATRYGNEMALKATAPEDLENSLAFGRPLDGVAAFPPGTKVAGGEILDYEEYDVNRKDGNFRRYPGEKYRDEDLKGKGIEGFDGDLAEKKKKEAKHKRGKSLDAIVNKSRNTNSPSIELHEFTNSVRRNGSTAGRLEGAAARIKRTFSIKRKEKKLGDA
ncbi:hypothetical protein ABW20_dc0108470 [Dactylellina cionopaga]|nr:hypothetical protein ABW20_dc0108470 [Dactylellina cionopaga]